MIRLLTVRATVAALKRALAVSDRLRPVTWRTLAVALAALAALSFWGHARTSRKYERALSALSDKTPFLDAHEWAAAETDDAGSSLEFSFPSDFSSEWGSSLEMSFPGDFSSGWDATPVAGSDVDFLPRQAFSADGHRLATGQSHVLLWSRPAAVADFDTTTYLLTSSVASTAKPLLSARAVAGAVGGQPRFVSLYAHLAPGYAAQVSSAHTHAESGGVGAALGGPSAAWWGEGFDLLRLLRHAPNVSLSPPPPQSDSFLATLQRLALLFQAVVFTVGSIFATAFGLIACYRSRFDLALKRIQLRQAELELQEHELGTEDKRIRLRLAQMELEDREAARAEQSLRVRLLQMDVEDRERARAEEAARRAAEEAARRAAEEAAGRAAAEPRILVVSY